MTRPRKLLAPGLTALTLLITTWLAGAQSEVLTLTNLAVRVMGANLTTGNYQRYETPGTNILVGLKPDVVAIQEFKFLSPTGLGTGTPAALREMVDLCFGTNFSYYREPYEASGDLPNGIISRWPIVASGSWPSPQVSNRGFAWAQIRPPGTNDLYVVSVHLHTATASSRAIEAGVIKSNRLRFFPANAWVIVAGDFNTDNRSEAAVSTFKTFLSDQPIPTDQNSNANTSAPRSKPYDYVLPSFSFTNFLMPVVIGSRTFSSGLVFDSRVYTPIAEVAPVTAADSGASNMQHMGVVKDFRLRWAVTNYRPAIITQPLPQTVPPGGTATFSVGTTGTPPLSYQWRRNTSPLAGATQSTLSLTNVSGEAQGNYTAVVTNGFGSVTSLPAPLNVLVPPTITQPPTNQSAAQGAAATFNVTTTGSAPLAYQWRFNDAPLPGATATAYTCANVQPATQGAYAVVVTNAAGSVTSLPALLNLLVPPPTLQMPAPTLLRWTGLSNFAYRVESATNPAAPAWTTLGTAFAPGPDIVFSNTWLQDPCRLFRVVFP
jgi:endonuclease/exonuclease/phosphatase family metal-dependent hydrolase